MANIQENIQQGTTSKLHSLQWEVRTPLTPHAGIVEAGMMIRDGQQRYARRPIVDDILQDMLIKVLRFI